MSNYQGRELGKWLWYFPHKICISLLELYIVFTHLGVNFLHVGFSSHFLLQPAQLSYDLAFLIRRFYNTFINVFLNLHAFKHIYIFFKRNIFTIKPLHAWLLNPLGILFKSIFLNSISSIWYIAFNTGRQPNNH